MTRSAFVPIVPVEPSTVTVRRHVSGMGSRARPSARPAGESGSMRKTVWGEAGSVGMEDDHLQVIVEERRGEVESVEAVQHAAVAGDDGRGVLLARHALQERRGEVAD